MDRHGVDKAVVICARIDHNPANNEYVHSVASKRPDRLVQFPDVDSNWLPEYHTPGAAGRLRRAIDAWGISGFTHYLGSGNDGWLHTDEGMAFFELAAEHDLVASIAGGQTWWSDLRDVAAAYPTLPILIHHQGMASSVEGPGSDSVREVIACAALPNIVVKASGFYYGSAAPAEYPYAAQVEVFARIVAAFGAKRLTWGSDFPVSPWHACTYRQALDIVRLHCAELIGEAGMAWVMGETMETLLRTRRPVAG